MKKTFLFAMIFSILCTAFGTGSYHYDYGDNSVYASETAASYEIYKQGKTLSLSDDGTIGIPIKLSVYYSSEKKASPGYNGTVVVLYVINHMAERTGTDSDEKIICSMLDRGYIVTVADYMNNEKAVSPQLDKSVQSIRNNLSSGKYFTNMDLISNGTYYETFIVPSGYDISLNNVYWEFDKHSTDGTLEKIVETWNTDFRSVKGERIIKWVDEFGNKKEVQNAYDGSSPIWLNNDGTANEAGEYIKIKYTKANTVFDCVKNDGSPLDYNLYMHIIYPTNPRKKVPVMCLASSNEHLASGAATADRPQLAGFTFNGYAGVMYDYGYVPMARKDHYGYFDGSSSEGHISGDNLSYSLHFYNNINIDTAAMRYVRYLSMSDGNTFSFDTKSIGVFGNSKGGWMTFLGEEDPTSFSNNRYFKNHHGETRFEAGKTKAEKYIDGGEPQPWQSFNGESIDSGADFVYASCGGNEMYISENHSPTFVSCHTKDNSYYTTSNSFANLCRIYDIPSAYFEINLGHTLAQNKDINHGTDTYNALFDFAGYYLKNDPVKIMYTSPADGEQNISCSQAINIKFTGPVPQKELGKISITESDGKSPKGFWQASYGNTEWTYNLCEPLNANKCYTLKVTNDLCGDNGKPIGSDYTYSFTTKNEKNTELQLTEDNDLSYFSIKIPDIASDDQKAKVVVNCQNDAANTLELYTTKQSDNGSRVLENKITEINLSGKGLYECDLSEFIKTQNSGEIVSMAIKKKYPPETRQKFYATLASDNELRGTASGNFSNGCVANAPDGTKAFKVNVTTNIRSNGVPQYAQEDFYDNKTRVFKNASCIGKITDADYGRRFTVNFRVYDEISRRIAISLTPRSDKALEIVDYNQVLKNVSTEAGKWIDVSVDYNVYDSKYGSLDNFYKTLYINGESSGNTNRAIYFSDLKATETITDADIDRVFLSYSNNGETPIIKPDNLITPYGTIPDEYASADEYPFAVFGDNGAFVGAYKDYAIDGNASALFGARFANYDNVFIYLRKDYKYDSASPYNNLSFSKCNLVIDLGGHKFTCAKYPMLYARGRHENITDITVKNGTVSSQKAAPIKFVYTTSTTYDGSVAKIFNIDFENVKFGFEDGYTPTNLIDFNNTASAINGIANVSFAGCEFDFTANFGSSNYTLFESGDEIGKITSNVNISGCSIYANSLDNIIISKTANQNSKLVFDDEKTYIILPKDYNASSYEIKTSGGTKYLDAESSDIEKTKYAVCSPYTVINRFTILNNGIEILNGDMYSQGTIIADLTVSAFKTEFNGYACIAEYETVNGIKTLTDVCFKKIDICEKNKNIKLESAVSAKSNSSIKVFLLNGINPIEKCAEFFSEK